MAVVSKMAVERVAFLTLASLLGRVANRVAQRLVPSKDMLDGFPRWRWLLGVFGQAVVFPALMLCAALRGCPPGVGSFQEWLMLSASELSGFESWYIYALCASQTRDMFPMPAGASKMMKIHHWLVVIASLVALNVPQGFGLFTLGTFVLELGSLFFNLHVLYPESKTISAIYQCTMLSSNLAAVVGGLVMLWMPGIPKWMKALYFAADVGVCIGRQHHALKAAGILPKKVKHEADADEGNMRLTGDEKKQ